jgi:hypothetical protein
MLFIEVGSGYSGITLAVGWMQSGCFNPDGSIQDTVAKHESTSRTIASIGELGFYFTYGTIGGIWGEIQGGLGRPQRHGLRQPVRETHLPGDPAPRPHRATADVRRTAPPGFHGAVGVTRRWAEYATR